MKSIAQASVTGHGTNVIQGLAVSLESTALPTIVIIAGILVTYKLAGLFGTAIAVTTRDWPTRASPQANTFAREAP